jgi:hypothetical protein
MLQIHEAPLSASHEHPAGATMLTLSVPPAAGRYTSVVERVMEHGPEGVWLLPDWTTVKTCPPMVTVPARDAPEFGSTVKDTELLPDPLIGCESQIHEVLLDAVHEQPAGASMAIAPLPPADVKLAVVAGKVTAHGPVLVAACVTVKVSPAIVSVPLRPAGAAFGVTENETLPVPTPELPDVTVIHDAFASAVHEQPAGAVTVVPLVPPAAASEALVAERANVHAGGGGGAVAPASETEKVSPAIVIVPLREEVPGFACTVKPTAPLPLPAPPDVTVIHEAFDCALQAHPAGATTPVLVDPPAAGNDVLELESAYVHAGGGGGGCCEDPPTTRTPAASA